jgi:hypothetical protein
MARRHWEGGRVRKNVHHSCPGTSISRSTIPCQRPGWEGERMTRHPSGPRIRRIRRTLWCANPPRDTAAARDQTTQLSVSDLVAGRWTQAARADEAAHSMAVWTGRLPLTNCQTTRRQLHCPLDVLLPMTSAKSVPSAGPAWCKLRSRANAAISSPPQVLRISSPYGSSARTVSESMSAMRRREASSRTTARQTCDQTVTKCSGRYTEEAHSWASSESNLGWAMRDSNPRPSRCKRDALAG